ncbi:hypothetical protein [Streptomyces sp. KN37]|uniref:hypothetical protein n=1 Tax=Streptomyces sp. KN37 TaxID=3090667 RepID=UPI002A756096|nr:hypothetical protein [Streptomyces sp. KN37]WPO70257.1 hypothetical protein R9806_06240 [Streptomyces sp. KN37]
MTTIGIPPRTPESWDRPAAEVAAEAACITLRQAAARTHSPSDRIAYALDQQLLIHPEACSTDATYPGWAEHIAALQAANPRQPARKEMP